MTAPGGSCLICGQALADSSWVCLRLECRQHAHRRQMTDAKDRILPDPPVYNDAVQGLPGGRNLGKEQG